jgi:hypothetical protein
MKHNLQAGKCFIHLGKLGYDYTKLNVVQRQ